MENVTVRQDVSISQESKAIFRFDQETVGTLLDFAKALFESTQRDGISSNTPLNEVASFHRDSESMSFIQRRFLTISGDDLPEEIMMSIRSIGAQHALEPAPYGGPLNIESAAPLSEESIDLPLINLGEPDNEEIEDAIEIVSDEPLWEEPEAESDVSAVLDDNEDLFISEQEEPVISLPEINLSALEQDLEPVQEEVVEETPEAPVLPELPNIELSGLAVRVGGEPESLSLPTLGDILEVGRETEPQEESSEPAAGFSLPDIDLSGFSESDSSEDSSELPELPQINIGNLI